MSRLPGAPCRYWNARAARIGWALKQPGEERRIIGGWSWFDAPRVTRVAGKRDVATNIQKRGATPQDPRMATGDAARLFHYSDRRATVSVIKGDNRRKNVYDALVVIDDQIQPTLKTRKYVLIKPNGLDPSRQLISTQPDAVHGILDYLAPRFKGPVVVAECGGSPSRQATSEFGWSKVFAEHKPIDLWEDAPDSGENAEHPVKNEKTVRASDTLQLKLAPSGGTVAIFSPAK